MHQKGPKLSSTKASTQQPLNHFFIKRGVYIATHSFFFFLWWLGFEPRTLHILCIVHTNWVKLTRTTTHSFSKLKHNTIETEKQIFCRNTNIKSAKYIKGTKSFPSYLGDDGPNVSNIEISHFDIYDPRNWKNFDNMSRDILVEKRLTRKMNLNFPNDKYFSHFSYANYSRKLSTDEISDWKWLLSWQPS